MDQSLQTMLIFLYMITALLFLMSFFQLLLSIEGNVKDNMWQVGVLRSIGLRKEEVKQVVLTEATANILAAEVIGCALGYIVMVSSMTLMSTIFELPINFDVDWLTLVMLIAVSVLTVYIGTSIGISQINNQKISKILKGSA